LVFSKYRYAKNVVRPIAWSIKLHFVSCILPCGHETSTIAAIKDVGWGSWCVTLSLFVRCRNNTRCICISPGRDSVVRTQVMCGYADINWLTSWLNMDPCGNTEEMQCSKQTSPAPHNLRLASAPPETHYCRDLDIKACSSLLILD
jgi:hypothetical protein